MKYRLLCLFSCISIGLFAQSDTNFKRINTGIKVGTDVGIIALDNGNEQASTRLDFGYSIIVDFVEYRLNEKFGINLGVGFTNRKYRQTIKDIFLANIKGQVLIKEHLLVQNIEIPLTFKYYLPKKNDNRQVYCSVGSSLYFNLYSESQQEIFFQESIWEFNHQSDIERTTFAANLNIGILFFSDYRISYYLEPTLQINPNKINFQYGNASNALINLGVLVGMKF